MSPRNSKPETNTSTLPQIYTYTQTRGNKWESNVHQATPRSHQHKRTVHWTKSARPKRAEIFMTFFYWILKTLLIGAKLMWKSAEDAKIEHSLMVEHCLIHIYTPIRTHTNPQTHTDKSVTGLCKWKCFDETFVHRQPKCSIVKFLKLIFIYI